MLKFWSSRSQRLWRQIQTSFLKRLEVRQFTVEFKGEQSLCRESTALSASLKSDFFSPKYSVSRQVWDGFQVKQKFKKSSKIIEQRSIWFKVSIQFIIARINILSIENLKNRDTRISMIFWKFCFTWNRPKLDGTHCTNSQMSNRWIACCQMSSGHMTWSP